MPEKDNFATRVINFNANLAYYGALPEGISIMNPFRENLCATPASEKFYQKYYSDNRRRLAVLGINPGRFGAGITGVPFTDPVRLSDCCNIHIPECPHAREPSSVFVYEIIHAYGGVENYYARWYINSVCPLGFTRTNQAGREVNYNYYDSKVLENMVEPFIVETLKEQINLGLQREICFCFGKDKNFRFLQNLNNRHHFFEKIKALDHPRYIAQYKSREMVQYAKRYAQIFRAAAEEYRV